MDTEINFAVEAFIDLGMEHIQSILVFLKIIKNYERITCSSIYGYLAERGESSWQNWHGFNFRTYAHIRASL